VISVAEFVDSTTKLYDSMHILKLPCASYQTSLWMIDYHNTELDPLLPL